MSDEFVSQSRYELGLKAAKDGDSIHDGASDEFREGYRRGSIGFGSNVMPKRFGADQIAATIWYCVCGYENKSTRVAKKGGEVVCWNCGVPRAYGEDHEREVQES